MNDLINMVRGKSLIIVLTIFVFLQMLGIVNISVIFPFIAGKEAGILAGLVFLLTSSLARFDLSRFASKDAVNELDKILSDLKAESEVCKVERDSLKKEFIELAKANGVLDKELRELRLETKHISEELLKKDLELNTVRKFKN